MRISYNDKFPIHAPVCTPYYSRVYRSSIACYSRNPNTHIHYADMRHRHHHHQRSGNGIDNDKCPSSRLCSSQESFIHSSVAIQTSHEIFTLRSRITKFKVFYFFLFLNTSLLPFISNKPKSFVCHFSYSRKTVELDFCWIELCIIYLLRLCITTTYGQIAISQKRLTFARVK